MKTHFVDYIISVGYLPYKIIWESKSNPVFKLVEGSRKNDFSSLGMLVVHYLPKNVHKNRESFFVKDTDRRREIIYGLDVVGIPPTLISPALKSIGDPWIHAKETFGFVSSNDGKDVYDDLFWEYDTHIFDGSKWITKNEYDRLVKIETDAAKQLAEISPTITHEQYYDSNVTQWVIYMEVCDYWVRCEKYELSTESLDYMINKNYIKIPKQQ